VSKTLRSVVLLLLGVVSAVAVAAAAVAEAPGETRLLRYPDIHGDSLAFVYAGDIWLASAQGGVARRLTSGPGAEIYPKFSPDGRWIAFTGQYNGTRQVYVIPVEGGTPRQLTFHNDVGPLPLRGGVDNQVMGWTPDGKQVLFNAHRVPWSDRIARPYLVPVDGGMEKPLPMPEGATGTLSPDGTRYAYAPVQHEFRGWKAYRGGRAPDVWVYDLQHDSAERITDDPATDNLPVWAGETLYFVSDRNGHLNLFSYDFKSKAARQATHSDVFDVLWPSSDGKRIVYELGGALQIFDPATGKAAPVSIRVEGDLAQTLPHIENVKDDAQAMALSPTGKRVLLEARGDVFSVPAEKGEIRNLTATSGIRESAPSWSPNGRWVAYLSDRTGEMEIYVRAGDGSGEERRVTTDGTLWRYPPSWSPDSKKLAFGDKDRKLRWVDVASGKVTDADRSSTGDINDYRWSPDSRFLAYTKTTETQQQQAIWIYSFDDGKARPLTDGFSADSNPVFDPLGRYLYFLSNRDFNLTFSGFEFDYVYTGPTRVYAGILAKDGPALFPPQSDDEKPAAEETDKGDKGNVAGKAEKGDKAESADKADKKDEKKDAAEKEEGAAKGKDKAKGHKPPKVTIDFDGFANRLRALGGGAGSYQNLEANDEAVFYLTGDGPQDLKQVDLKEGKEATVLEAVQGFELSADGKKILYRQRGAGGVIDTKPGHKAGDGALALDHLEMRIDPYLEWRQMYDEAWRVLRDWFYDPAMHGVDWKGMHDKYGALLPYVASRADLDFLLHELGAELRSGHVYVEGGSAGRGLKRVEGGLLGAEIEAGPAGSFRVAHIFPGENWHDDFRSPLTEAGVKVKEGDYILAVDGRPSSSVKNFYALLDGKAGQIVTLLVNGEPTTKGAHEERVKTVRSEQNLRYLDWSQATRAKVEKLAGGRIGYIHLPNTAVEGNRELYKGFYPMTERDALIFDDRWNGGGFIPDRMISLISRPILSYWVTRGGHATSTPSFAHSGPKVALINGQAGSGGDAFPYYFREMHLGPLIGTRTWGGLIGLSGNPPLVDGGTVTVPTFRFLTTEGKWAVEDEGVAPDMEVIDRPDAWVKGHDLSLEAAVDYLLKELQKNPPKKLVVPPPPKGGAAH
jgi:tricorn protease